MHRSHGRTCSVLFKHFIAITTRYMQLQPITCSHDPLLSATNRYLLPQPVTATVRYLRPRPVTYYHDPLLAATIRYFPRSVTCRHDLLLAATIRYLRPQPVTSRHDPLLVTTTCYLQIWNKAVSKVPHVLYCLNSPVAVPAAYKAHQTTLFWISGGSWWMFGAFTSCAPLFCLLMVHTDKTGLHVLTF